MADEKILLGDDVVNRETPEYKELIDGMESNRLRASTFKTT